jgi:thiamine pyrophosphokinase
MKVVIISGGTPPSLDLLQQEIADSSYLIGADGGTNFLHDHALLPHLVIGDLDSITISTLKFIQAKKIPIECHPNNKDCTDTQLALHKAISLGATEIVFLGCTGGNRIDHLFGNVGLLLACLEHHIKASIKDINHTIVILDRPTTITGIKGKIFSLHAYSDLVTNLTITGAKFNLSNYDLKLGSTLTLSNEFLTTQVSINFKSGKLLLIRERVKN